MLKNNEKNQSRDINIVDNEYLLQRLETLAAENALLKRDLEDCQKRLNDKNSSSVENNKLLQKPELPIQTLTAAEPKPKYGQNK